MSSSRAPSASGNKDIIPRPPYLDRRAGSAQTQAPSSQPRSRFPNTQGGSTMGSIYAAFGNYEREIRQRKYWIAECEDTLSGLKKAKAERINKRTGFQSESSKLEMEAKAAEATRQKNRKEKELIENRYQKLSSEMDNLSERSIARQTMIKKIEVFRQEKVQYAEAKTREHKIAYMKIPAVANLFNARERREGCQSQMKETNKNVETRRQTFSALSAQHSQTWEAFTKKCVEIAKSRLETRKKTQLTQELQAECKNNKASTKRPAAAPVGIGRRSDYGSQAAIPSSSQRSPFQLIQNQRESLTKRIGSVVVRRPSSFQQMDRILKRPDNWQNYVSKSHDWSARSEKLMPPPSIPRKSGASLVSELRSRLRAPVKINPMPRYLGSPGAKSTVTATQESMGNNDIPDAQESIGVVSQLTQNEAPVISSLPQPIQTNPPIAEKMDTTEGLNVDTNNSLSKDVEASNADTTGAEADKLPPGNSKPVDAFSSFSSSKEAPSPPGGLFGMEFSGPTPQSSFLDKSSDFFGSSSASSPDPASDNNQNDSFSFFFN